MAMEITTSINTLASAAADIAALRVQLRNLIDTGHAGYQGRYNAGYQGEGGYQGDVTLGRGRGRGKRLEEEEAAFQTPRLVGLYDNTNYYWTHCMTSMIRIVVMIVTGLNRDTSVTQHLRTTKAGARG